jgi:hypothetical protein
MICPNPEHAGSRVKLDGSYGKPGHRRQRYKCSPRGGSKPHVFTELLPREESWRDSYEHCDLRVNHREGPKAPRHYQFVARGIAEALHAVGAGASYMRASRIARDRARRFRFDAQTGELRESAHGQLVADWVELFAPIVFEARRPGVWPVEGSLLLDHLPFRIRALDRSGKPIPGGRVTFDVFCAVGYRAGRPRLWQAEAFASAHLANWRTFLGSLPGEPKRIVCDAHSGMRQAIVERWSCTNMNGTCSMRWSACWPRGCSATQARNSSSYATASRGRSWGPLFGVSSCGWPGLARTRASIVGLPSTVL